MHFDIGFAASPLTSLRPLEEMTSDEAREVFEVFVSLWNDRKLSMMYYDGNSYFLVEMFSHK